MRREEARQTTPKTKEMLFFYHQTAPRGVRRRRRPVHVYSTPMYVTMTE